jgi:hypothetical protein
VIIYLRTRLCFESRLGTVAVIPSGRLAHFSHTWRQVQADRLRPTAIIETSSTRESTTSISKNHAQANSDVDYGVQRIIVVTRFATLDFYWGSGWRDGQCKICLVLEGSNRRGYFERPWAHLLPSSQDERRKTRPSGFSLLHRRSPLRGKFPCARLAGCITNFLGYRPRLVTCA